MAAVAGQVLAVETLVGPFDQPSGGIALVPVLVSLSAASTNVTTSDTLDIATLGTTIAAWIRDGKAYTVRSVGLCQVYRTGVTQLSATVAMSSTTLRLSSLVTCADFSTGTQLTASNPIDAPFKVLAFCSVA